VEIITNNIGESLVTIGILLLIIEVVVLGFSTFILTFVGLASLITGLLVFIGLITEQLMPIVLSITVFTTLFALTLWKPLKQFQNRQDRHTVKNDFIGVTFLLTADISEISTATHKLSGIEWQVKAKQSIPSGVQVRVVEAEVGTLWVEAV